MSLSSSFWFTNGLFKLCPTQKFNKVISGLFIEQSLRLAEAFGVTNFFKTCHTLYIATLMSDLETYIRSLPESSILNKGQTKLEFCGDQIHQKLQYRFVHIQFLYLSQTQGSQQSVTKFVELILTNLVTPKVGKVKFVVIL